MPTKILMSLASLAAVAQALTGMMMWWKRWRPEAGSGYAGRQANR